MRCHPAASILSARFWLRHCDFPANGVRHCLWNAAEATVAEVSARAGIYRPNVFSVLDVGPGASGLGGNADLSSIACASVIADCIGARV